MNKDRILFIVGPTAIGKTRLAIKIARSMGGEVISADSMQIYKGMRILSQAPTMRERRSVRHHLVGALDPARKYSAASFKDLASNIAQDIIRRNKTPLIVGGSGLYVKAFVDGLFPSPKADLPFRKKLETFARRYGSVRLHKRLSKIDPESAAKIHPNDLRRIIRALEIYRSTGSTMADLKKRTRGLMGLYDIRIFALTRPRDEIYSAIDSRVDAMFREGVLSEVKRLKKKRMSITAKAALGFGEIDGYLKGKYSIEEAKMLIKMNTRRFAKRQLTWFRADDRIRWFDMSKMSEGGIVKEILRAFKL